MNICSTPRLTLQASAGEMARQVASGEVLAIDLVEEHITRIEAVDPKLNAVVVKRYDAARKEAQAIDARRKTGERLPALAGVPVTIKESLDLQGLVSTYGLPSRKGSPAASDEPHVAKLREAGAIVLGKTNVAQLLLFIESDNPVFGRTNNPWNLERSCGGSSGGEGAIIAAGGSALGLGTDIGGSCRYPASFCGIAGIKPTKGRCPDAGLFSVPRGEQTIASQIGVMARTTADIALGLATIDGSVSTPLVHVPRLGDFQTIDTNKLSVGFYTDDDVMRSSPAVRRAVKEAAAYLEKAGVRVIEWSPPSPLEALRLGFSLMSADGGKHFRSLLRGGAIHPSVKSLLLLATRSATTLSLMRSLLNLAGQTGLAEATRLFGHTSISEYWQLTEQLMAYRSNFVKAMDTAGIDLVLGPACAVPPVYHGASKDIGLAGAHAIMHNVTGFPAGTVPVTRVRQGEEGERPPTRDIVERAARNCEIGSAGLPIGVQIAGKPWREDQVLAVMNVIEQAARTSADFPHAPPS